LLIVKSKEIDNAMQNFCNRVSFKRKTSQEFVNMFVAVAVTKFEKEIKNKVKGAHEPKAKWSELILVSLA